MGRYGQYMNCGLTEILQQLQTQKLKDESLQFPQNAFMTAQRGVAAAFELGGVECEFSLNGGMAQFICRKSDQ